MAQAQKKKKGFRILVELTFPFVWAEGDISGGLWRPSCVRQLTAYALCRGKTFRIFK